jgi:hypothetical protein
MAIKRDKRPLRAIIQRQQESRGSSVVTLYLECGHKQRRESRQRKPRFRARCFECYLESLEVTPVKNFRFEVEGKGELVGE